MLLLQVKLLKTTTITFNAGYNMTPNIWWVEADVYFIKVRFNWLVPPFKY